MCALFGESSQREATQSGKMLTYMVFRKLEWQILVNNSCSKQLITRFFKCNEDVI